MASASWVLFVQSNQICPLHRMTTSLTFLLLLKHTDNYFLLLVQLVSYFVPLSSWFCCASQSNLISSLPLCILLSPEVNEELLTLKSCYLTMFLIFHAKWKIMYVLTTHVFKEFLPPFGSLISQTSFLENFIFQMFEFTEVYFRKIHHFSFASSPPRLPLSHHWYPSYFLPEQSQFTPNQI